MGIERREREGGLVRSSHGNSTTWCVGMIEVEHEKTHGAYVKHRHLSFPFGLKLAWPMLCAVVPNITGTQPTNTNTGFMNLSAFRCSFLQPPWRNSLPIEVTFSLRIMHLSSCHSTKETPKTDSFEKKTLS